LNLQPLPSPNDHGNLDPRTKVPQQQPMTGHSFLSVSQLQGESPRNSQNSLVEALSADNTSSLPFSKERLDTPFGVVE